MTTMTVVGTFTDRSDAVAAVKELRDAGFAESQIGLITKHEPTAERTGWQDDPTHTRWEEGVGIGAAAGALTGAGLGLAVLVGVVPPLGPVIAGGALLALLASAGGGAAVGTIVGGLVGLGIPEDEAVMYEGDVNAGRTLVAVSAGPRYAEAVDVLHRHNANVRASDVLENPERQ
ncbi:MAG TPA: hypothetical protein VFG68_23760 [Fimbriiglobus sp.]|nr:hypothetical protein [Fimbriiglobus sp.]